MPSPRPPKVPSCENARQICLPERIPDNLQDIKLGSPSWESGPESGLHEKLRIKVDLFSGLLRLENSLEQLRTIYSSLRLQLCVLRT